jgi:putative heme iron utilization protein
MTDWKATEQGSVARRLMRTLDFGVLSSMSTELPGYPFGSVTPYVLSHGGRPVIYVSDIAQHTANMKADPKTCLTVAEVAGADNQQALGRVTLVGDGVKVPESEVEAVQARYYAFFPEARHYGAAHGFDFYWLEPKRVRYIAGFGKIFWIEAEDWAVPTAEWAPAESGVVEHMNADHGNSMLKMLKHFCGVRVESAEMLACDAEGFHLRADDVIRYIAFPAPCMDVEALRSAMVELARSSS